MLYFAPLCSALNFDAIITSEVLLKLMSELMGMSKL